MVNPPCPMLDGKLCSIYENVAICPIAFNAFEELKTKLGWLQGRRNRQHWPAELARPLRFSAKLTDLLFPQGTRLFR
jgi:hypothetical protein